ncbi:MAG: hypothetical protein IIB39_04750 [Candidatus Marinimicrobia bacterium]|nr:hypothetical protein [Candidatus Neomarinimicrobiota bacterium]
MNRFQILAVLIFLVLKTGLLFGQDFEFENYINSDTEIEGASDLYDYLEEFIRDTINLNEDSLEKLSENPLIDASTLKRVKAFRNQGELFNDARDIRSLQLEREQEDLLISISGFGFKKPELERVTIRNRVIRNSSDNGLQVFPYKYYTRAATQLKNGYSAGVLIERDPGEKELVDYFSFYFAGKNRNNEYNKIIGDYSLEIGQGLLFWGNGSFIKGGNPILTMRKQAKGILPYKSAVETRNLRGVAGSRQYGKIKTLAFASLLNRDAALSDSGDVLNFRESGLHRTESEIAGKNSVREMIIGFRSEWNTKKYKIGANFAIVDYDTEINPLKTPDKINDFAGSEYKSLSVDYNIKHSYFSLFGEVAGSNGGKTAQVHGAMAVYEKAQIGILYRDYEDGFRGVRGNPFGAGDNEKGIYAGIKLKLNKITTFSGFRDLYKRPWVTATIGTPSRREDYRLELNRQINRSNSISLRAWGANREENQFQTDEFGIERKIVQNRKRQNFRLKLKHRFSSNRTLNWQIERISVEQGNSTEYGYLLSSSIGMSLSNRIMLRLAVTLHNTDSFASRIYIYEHDFPGVLRNIAVYNKGYRFMVLASKDISTYFSASVKLERYSRSAQNESTEETRIGFQIDLSI